MTTRIDCPPLTIPPRYLNFLENRLGFSLHPPLLSDLEPIIDRVGSLSNRFIHRTAELHSYLDQPEDRLAYHAYYTTVNLPKMFFPLSEIQFGTGAFGNTTLRILDIGTGTGSALWGCLLWHKERFDQGVQAVAVDHSAAAIGDLQHDFKQLFPNDRLETHVIDLRRHELPRGEFDLIVMGNVLNELDDKGMALLGQLRKRIAPEGWVIILEPALLRTSRGLLQFRDAAVRSGWTVYAPCTRQAGCPALEKETDWCHHEVFWERPEFIRRIDENLGMIKKTLKFSYLTLNASGRNLAAAFPQTHDVRRVVSERFDEKGRTRIFMCGESGRHTYIRNNRDRQEGNRDVDFLERYDVVSCQSCTVRAHDVAIGKNSMVRLLRGGRTIDE